MTVEIRNASGRDLLLDPANTTPPMSWVGAPPEWGSTLYENASVTIGGAVDTPQPGSAWFSAIAAASRFRR